MKRAPYIFGFVVGFSLVCALGAVGAYEEGHLPFPALLALYGASFAVLWGFALITYTIGKRQAKQKRTGCSTPTFRKPTPMPPIPKPLYEKESECKTCKDCPHLGWFGDYALHYCGITWQQVEEDDECHLNTEEPWPKENPHIKHVGGHQPTKENDTAPPDCGSSVQRHKEEAHEERFFTPEEVCEMSLTEISENLEAIDKSMKKW